ncbi:MAG: TetR/AcrR family transcriptional regulator, partial [Spirulinaceae cyanobacterium RM2_2_10]|nr:TetR/AcrR family transcriptional regulator [Spirulinaceae cyanobacterium RM2_2_10]
MSRNRSSARQRLLDAAIKLFSEQGFAEATTRQIAELAQVNEVTLFRNFGSKHDLLLAAIASTDLFTCDWDALTTVEGDDRQLAATLRRYARDRLQTLSQFPQLLRAIVGESGHYTADNRQALGAAIQAANQALAKHLSPALTEVQPNQPLTAAQFAGLLDSLL